MRPHTRDVADQIVEDLMGLDSNEQRREVLAVIDLIFCGSCGRVASEVEVSVAGVSSICIHGREMPHGIAELQKTLDQEKADVKAAARLLRSRYPMTVTGRAV